MTTDQAVRIDRWNHRPDRCCNIIWEFETNTNIRCCNKTNTMIKYRHVCTVEDKCVMRKIYNFCNLIKQISYIQNPYKQWRLMMLMSKWQVLYKYDKALSIAIVFYAFSTYYARSRLITTFFLYGINNTLK